MCTDTSAAAAPGRAPDAGATRRATLERREELRAGLVAATEHIIASEGIEGVKARALALAVGCSVGAIYNAVADLDTLVLEVNARTLDAIAAALLAVPAGEAAAPAARPAVRLAALGLAYLDYAAAHPRRWSALFAHRMTGGNTVPAWYRDRQAMLFTHVEGPLAALRPDLSPEACALLARSLFSAVHGIVTLGLSGTLLSLPLEVQRAQLRLVVEAAANGLAHGPGAETS